MEILTMDAMSVFGVRAVITLLFIIALDKQLWKKSVTTFITIITVFFYFLFLDLEQILLSNVVLIVGLLFAWHRSMFKEEHETVFTWRKK
ncbi:MAG: hypothetical protein WC179_06980 [Candidatus Cloacimonadaceae bacterium]|nr:hypothetical protein [Candidatus Cloacimonadota bacterium]